MPIPAFLQRSAINWGGGSASFVSPDGERTMVTYLGVGVEGFPNLVTLAGPTGGSVSTNFPRGIETGVDWATELVQWMLEHGYSRIERVLAKGGRIN